MLLGASVVYSATAIGVGLVHSFWAAVTLYLLGMVAAGVFQPVRQAYIHLTVAREQRATVLSFASMIASVGSMAGQGTLGWIASRNSLATGYVVGGLLTSLAIPLVLAMRRLAGGPDRIVGKAGRYGTCTTLALPDGVAVGAEREVA